VSGRIFESGNSSDARRINFDATSGALRAADASAGMTSITKRRGFSISNLTATLRGGALSLQQAADHLTYAFAAPGEAELIP
jgi:hypothetical protein